MCTNHYCIFVYVCSRLCVTARLSIPAVNCNCFLTIQIVPSGNTLYTPPYELAKTSICLSFSRRGSCFGKIQFATKIPFNHVLTIDRKSIFDPERVATVSPSPCACCNRSTPSCSRRKWRRHVTGR